MKKLNAVEVAGLSGYYLTLAIVSWTSFYPVEQQWGFALWQFIPTPLLWLILGIAVVAPTLLLMIPAQFTPKSRLSESSHLVGWSVLTLVAIMLFWFFRVKMHLLGDGYALLNFLSDTGSHPFIKNREVGEGLIHLWTRSAIMSVWEVNAKSSALLSFQVISITSGAIAVGVTYAISRKLFAVRAERLLFASGMLSSGYMALFFGYVENYSIFVASVISFTLFGLISLRNRRMLFVVTLLAGLSIWLHIMGVSLVLALCYLMIHDSFIYKKFAGMHFLLKALGIIALVCISGFIFWKLYTTNLFFRFAFIPVTQTEFYASQYTLFSRIHAIDSMNLFFVLCPWLLMAIVLLINKRFRNNLLQTMKNAEARFLLILSVTAILITFILDPKLGMGRDWDLFAFTAVPLTALFFHTLLVSHRQSRGIYCVLALAVFLNVITIVSRLSVLRSESASIALYKSLLVNNDRHVQAGVQNLQDYYFATGDTAQGLAFTNQFSASFPEVALLKVSQSLSSDSSYGEAIEMLKRAIAFNPQYSPAYASIGANFIAIAKYDSAIAYLEVADGLNPYNWTTQEAVGYAYFSKGEYERSSQILYNLLEETDSLTVRGLVALMQISLNKRDMQEYHQLLKRMIQRPDAPAVAFIQIGDYYKSQNKMKLAYDAYVRAVALGADSSTLYEFEKRHRRY